MFSSFKVDGVSGGRSLVELVAAWSSWHNENMQTLHALVSTLSRIDSASVLTPRYNVEHLINDLHCRHPGSLQTSRTVIGCNFQLNK